MKYLFTRAFILTITAVSLSVAALGQRPDKLTTEQWRLTTLNGVRVVNQNAYLEINMNRSRFSGNTGCNRMFGSVSVTGRQIRFSGIGTTRMACIDQVARLDREVPDTLARVARYSQIGNRLDLYRGNRVVMRFTAIVKDNPDGGGTSRIGLEDRKWVLQQIGNQVNVKALPEAFINFDASKGSAGGNSSCNVFGGNYTTTGDRIRITNVVATMRACIEDERMTVERQFLDGLRDANRYEISNGLLRLYRDRRLVLTLRGERK